LRSSLHGRIMATYEEKASSQQQALNKSKASASDIEGPSVQRSLKGMDYASAVSALSPNSGPSVQMDSSGKKNAQANTIHSAAQKGVDAATPGIPHQAEVQSLMGPSVDMSSMKSVSGGVGKDACETAGANAMATQQTAVFKESNPDVKTVAHEVSHLKDQGIGAVTGLENGVGKVGDSYEQKAHAVADRVGEGKSAEDLVGR
jgi:hypothetical protein